MSLAEATRPGIHQATVQVPAGSIVTVEILRYRLIETMARPVAVHGFRKVASAGVPALNMADREFVHQVSPPQDTYVVEYHET